MLYSGSAVASSSMDGKGFPESFQRTVPDDHDACDSMSDISQSSPTRSDEDAFYFPQHTASERGLSPIAPPPRRVSRSSVMRLENILNDVSINPKSPPGSRSRSLGRSPVQQHFDLSEPSSPVSPIARSLSPDESPVKKKKVKMHRCPECHKEFPRPSGLKTHMNIHTKEKPYACTYPGCSRTFSVVSNAKRHMRTHGMGVSAEEGDQSMIPYVVGFEAPVVAELPDMESRTGRNQPVKLRWMSLGSETKAPEVSSSSQGGRIGNGAARLRSTRSPLFTVG
ncbi:hypothetical protein GALMADRAFT_253606 [Galerina marginata CBS 339.88]|uniref:C2H2-type domain-containing protein n=1 Tax=Galerina marginata (strain CBS 339.88) TaxID=685588 RepID=A0A067SVV7_GALM3|nr:hypothetical protein GALMADRAFT_253606 [Galerina marginata CBS 339.88]